MRKRTIPILICLMSFALLGIIFIQFRWINTAIDEKQALIDNNVYQAVNEVEEQLNDQRALTYFSDTMLHDVGIGTVEIDEEGNIIEEEFIQESFDDSDVQMEIKVMTSENSKVLTEDEEVIHTTLARHIPGDLDSNSFIEVKEGLGHIEALINKITLEVHSHDDYRIDSSRMQLLLSEGLAAKGLGEIHYWGVWDSQTETYKIKPSQEGEKTNTYNIPLFTADVINPGRYELRLQLNNQDIIWSEIWPMIILSLVFLLIISFVFIYSIKLAIKHKNISQIKTDFINNMTHEFKTPLASISLAADSLTHKNTILNPENVQKYVQIIQAEKNKLNAQVERILEVAALNKDAMEIPLEKVDLSKVVAAAINNYQLQIEKETIVFDYKDVGNIQLKANAFHLENVLVNLIDNGIKYTEGKAHISIHYEQEKNQLVVKDEGIGMTAEQLSKVFDNFYRVQSGDLHATKGFGLGLSYCKLVVEKMNGSIQLQSKLDKGTTAIIQFQTV